MQSGKRNPVRDYVDRVRSLQFARQFASRQHQRFTLLDSLAVVCYLSGMWKRFLHLLFITLLVVGNTGFLGQFCAAESDCDSSLPAEPAPAEPAEEENASADEIELGKFHSNVAYVPLKACIVSHQLRWNARSSGNTQLTECSHGAIGVRGPPPPLT